MILYFDTETTGLDPVKDRLRLFVYSEDGNEPVVVDTLADKSPARTIYDIFSRADIIVGFNIVFDLKFLNHFGVNVIDHYHKFFDIYLAARNILNGTGERLSLSAVAKRFIGVDLDKTQQKSDWSRQDLTREQIEYAKADVAVLPRLYDVLRDKLSSCNLCRVAARDSRCAAIVSAVSPFTIDVDGWLGYVASLEESIPSFPDLGSGSTSLFKGEPPFNPFSQREVISYFDKVLGIRIDSTDKYSLSKLEHPVAQYIREYRAAKKLIQCFGSDYINEHVVDSKLYANLRIFGAETGRMSCDKPNIQQIPAGFRKYMRGFDGESVVKLDYSQIELRLAAEVSGDSEMLRAFSSGEDIHTATAVSVFGSKDARKQAKALNFGLIYGMGAPKLVDYARTMYGVSFSVREAEYYIRQFFGKYRGLADWHRRMKVPTRDYSVRTALGRRRFFQCDRWPFSQAANTVIQGSAADGVLCALEFIAKELLVPKKARLLAVVHDEFVLSAKFIDAEYVRTVATKCMIDGMREVAKKVPIEVSSEILGSWK